MVFKDGFESECRCARYNVYIKYPSAASKYKDSLKYLYFSERGLSRDDVDRTSKD